MTFPAAFNVYWLVSSSMQLLISNAFRIKRFREACGLPDYLPGTKLERLNVKGSGEVFKPIIFST